MICQALKKRGLYVVPCKKCFNCRVNLKSEWTSRLLLEAACHPVSSFITLTYADEHLPDKDKFRGGNLSPDHLRDFTKRLRRHLDYHQQKQIRIFSVGEYGEQSGRAHYHAIVFGHGFALDEAGHCPELQSLWRFGFVSARPADHGSFAYVAGYVVKKFGAAQRVQGRQKEFIRCPRRPGLGVPAVRALAEMVKPEHMEFGDVPRGWVLQGKHRPFGRLVRKRLREMLFPGRADLVRETSAIASAHPMWLALWLSQPEVNRLIVESEKAAQAGAAVLVQLASREKV